MGAASISWKTTTPVIISILQIQANCAENLTFHTVTTVVPSFPVEIAVDKLHLPLYLTVLMCVAAILSVCLFTHCLLLAVKERRPGPRQSREISSDYETMIAGVGTEHEHHCSCSDQRCRDVSDLTPPPPDRCSRCAPMHRESVVTLGLGEYVDVDVPGHICQYQHLDLNQIEEHVYHSLYGNVGRSKEQINL